VIRQQETLAADIRVLAMPEGRDPDEVIRSDPSLWSELVEQAAPVLDYLFDAAARRHDLSSPRERSAALADLAPMVAAISDRVVQSHYLQRLSRMVGVDEQTLRIELRQPARRTSSKESPIADKSRADAARDRKEEFCLALLFKYPELRAEGLGVEPDLFAYSENRALFETWVGWADSGEPFERSLTPDLRPQFERIFSIELPAYDDDSLIKAFHGSVQRIDEQRLRYAKRASAAVLADIAANDGATIAERALSVWQTGNVEEDTAEDEADPAVAFVEDMEAGLKVHHRVLGQHRSTERPAR
jgi:DNA primase